MVAGVNDEFLSVDLIAGLPDLEAQVLDDGLVLFDCGLVELSIASVGDGALFFLFKLAFFPVQLVL